MEGLGPIAAAAAVFVGTHFLLSHLLRKPIVDTVGSAAFLGIHSVVAAATLGWLALAYRAAPLGTPLWPVGDGLGAVATVAMLLASTPADGLDRSQPGASRKCGPFQLLGGPLSRPWSVALC